MLLIAGPLLTRAAFLAASSLLLSHHPPTQPLPSLSSSTANLDYATQAPLIRSQVNALLNDDPTLTGPLLRLAFHDATTWDPTTRLGGPNGSIQYELEWSENRAISRPLRILQTIRTLSSYSTPVVSLADTIALAGATALEHAGGPAVAIRMGRIDATQADPYRWSRALQLWTERSRVTSTLPSPALDSDGLRLYFGRAGRNDEEWIALLGLHGLGRHVTLLGMPKTCLKNLTRTCLEEAPQTLPFVTSSVDRFSNDYFQYLLKWNRRDIELGQVAFLPTDVALVVDRGLRHHVERFAQDERYYAKVVARAYQKLVETTAVTRERY